MRTTARTRVALGVAAAVLAGAAGCGSEGSDEAEPAAAPPAQVNRAADVPPPAGPRPDDGDPVGVGAKGQIEETLSDVQTDFAVGGGPGVCRELSLAGQREVAALGSGERARCENVVFDLYGQIAKGGVKPRFSRVVAIRIDGGTAVARVRDRNGRARRVRFVKEEPSGWQLRSLADAEPLGAFGAP